MRVFLAVIFLAAASLPAAVADEQTDAVRAWIDANVPEMMREARMPGFAIALVRDGETIYADAFGARDREKNLLHAARRGPLAREFPHRRRWRAVGADRPLRFQKAELTSRASLPGPLGNPFAVPTGLTFRATAVRQSPDEHGRPR